MQRVIWVDNAKAILMFLVVLGHFHYFSGPLPGKDLIYAFHVPAFLFITGFLLSPDFIRVPPRQVLRQWVAVYLRAYVFFSLVAIAIWWAAEIAGARSLVSPFPALAGAAYGVAGPENWLVHQDQPLWYFPFLITSFLAAAVMARLPRPVGWALALAYAVFALSYQGPRLPWCLDIGGIGALVLFAGYQLRQHYDRVAPWLERRGLAAALAVGGCAVLVVLSGLNGTTNLNGALFGQSGVLFLAGIAAGVLAVIAVSALVPANRVMRLVSVNTLTIFALHIYAVRVLDKLLPQMGTPVGRSAIMILGSVLAMAGCLVLARLMAPVLERLVMRRQA